MIYSLELLSLDSQLVLALGSKDELLEFQQELDLDVGETVELTETGLTEYPVVVVTDFYSIDESFYYYSPEEFYKRCDEALVVNNELVFFYFYFFEYSFRFYPGDESWMEAVAVESPFLHQYGAYRNIEFLAEKTLESMVGSYNLEGLHVLAEQYIDNQDDTRKHMLAERGYLSLFYRMIHDYAAGILKDTGILNLTVLADRAANLLNKDLNGVKGEAYSCLMDYYLAEDKKQAHACGKKALDYYRRELRQTQVSDKLEYMHRLAQTHLDIMDLEPHRQLRHFDEALKLMREVVQLNLREADWVTYLELLYRRDPRLTRATDELESVEAQEFQQALKTLIAREPGYVAVIALAFQEFIRRSTDANAPVLRVILWQYNFWLDQAADVSYDELSRAQLFQVSELFTDEGVRLNRLTLLQATVRVNEAMWNDDEVVLSLNNVAAACERVAKFSVEAGDQEHAQIYMNKAWMLYRDHLTENRNNYFYLVNYADFLKRLTTYSWLATRPSLHDVRQVAEMGYGLEKDTYTACAFLLVGICLHENNEDEAITLLIRILLLHELEVYDQIEHLYETLDRNQFKTLGSFLEATITFMHAVADGYYFDPQFNWEKVMELNPLELATAWNELKKELLYRKNQFSSEDPEVF